MTPFGGSSKKKRIEKLEEATKGIWERLDSLNDRIQRLQSGANQAALPQVPQPTVDFGSHTKLLKRVAGVAYVRLYCHRDTWDFLVAKAADTEHFHLPGITKEHDRYLVKVDVSGPALISILEALRKIANQPPGSHEGTRNMASKIYQRIARALKQAVTHDPAQPRGHGVGKKRGAVRVYIDDRPPAAA